MAYHSIVKVNHFPSLFIYDHGKLIELGGELTYNTIKKYIDEKYFFSCNKIPNEKSLKDKILALSSKRFFIGIFTRSAKIYKIFEIFEDLMHDNILIIDNCFYYIREEVQSNILPRTTTKDPDFLNFYSNYKNFILINNGEKMNIFEDIDYLSDYFENITKSDISKELKHSINYFKLLAKNYFLDNSFPSILEFKIENLNQFFSNPKFRVIFCYDENNKGLIMNLLKKFAAIHKNIEDYNILYFDIENKKGFNQEELNYLSFSEKPGVYFTNNSFENIYSLHNEDLVYEKISKFTNENIKNIQASLANSLLNKSKNIIENSSDVYNGNHEDTKYIIDGNIIKQQPNYIDNKKNMQEKKYVTAKIVESLEHINYDESGEIKDIPKNIKSENGGIKNIAPQIINKSEKVKLAENFIDLGKNQLAHINLINNPNNRSNNKNLNISSREKIKVYLIYLLIYCIIFYTFYLRITRKFSETKYN